MTRRRSKMRARFDRIFRRHSGRATLARLNANKPELAMALVRPETLLHTNESERDIHRRVIKRKISGATHTNAGCDCRDALLGLVHTCTKFTLRSG